MNLQTKEFIFRKCYAGLIYFTFVTLNNCDMHIRDHKEAVLYFSRYTLFACNNDMGVLPQAWNLTNKWTLLKKTNIKRMRKKPFHVDAKRIIIHNLGLHSRLISGYIKCCNAKKRLKKLQYSYENNFPSISKTWGIILSHFFTKENKRRQTCTYVEFSTYTKTATNPTLYCCWLICKRQVIPGI